MYIYLSTYFFNYSYITFMLKQFFLTQRIYDSLTYFSCILFFVYICVYVYVCVCPILHLEFI